MKRRTIDTATARELAVEAKCDPRTIKGVLDGSTPVRTLSSKRAWEVLVKKGYVEDVAKAS